jgi:hypothetical protein
MKAGMIWPTLVKSVHRKAINDPLHSQYESHHNKYPRSDIEPYIDNTIHFMCLLLDERIADLWWPHNALNLGRLRAHWRSQRVCVPGQLVGRIIFFVRFTFLKLSQFSFQSLFRTLYSLSKQQNIQHLKPP